MANRDLPMMPWFPGDFATATSAWTLLERAVYRELLDAQWILEKLPTSPERLALIARCSIDEFAKAWETVKDKFSDINGCLYNERLEEHRAESIRLKQQKASAGSSGGKASAAAKLQQRLSAASSAAQAEGVAKSNPPSPSPSPGEEPEGGGFQLTGGKPERQLHLHASLPSETWEEWLGYRRKKKWPCDTTTLQKQLNVLAEHDTDTQRRALNDSMQANWKGVFPKAGRKQETVGDPNQFIR